MIAPDAHSGEAVLAALERHDQRRRRDVPTISVLVGPIMPALRLFSHWAETVNRSMVNLQLEKADSKAVVVPWIDKLAKTNDLGTASIQWLAQRLNRDFGALERSLRLMTSHELEVFLESCLPLGSRSNVEFVSRRLIERWATRTWPQGRGGASDLDALFEGHGWPWPRIFKAVGELIDRDRLPVVAISLANPSLIGLEAIARLLAELGAVQPQAVLALMVEQELFDSFVARAPASRAKALLLESIVTLIRERLSATDEPVLPLRVAADSTSENPVADELDSMISDQESVIDDPESSQQLSKDNDDDARSAAERFLLGRLESVAETAGIFELNATLDFHFGSNRWIEVDLVARSLKLAIEVDGYYHFLDPEAFRRDRRKDLELQKRGYLVVRVLAEDVVERLEEVMATILAAVAFRRAATIRLGTIP